LEIIDRGSSILRKSQVGGRRRKHSWRAQMG
jgi:hypothetical protein